MKNGRKENARGSHKNKELKKLVNRKTKQSENVWKQKGEGCPKVYYH